MEGDHNKDHGHKHVHEDHRSDHGHHGHHKEHHHEHHGHGHSHGNHHGHHHHDFSDVERWTQFFDSPDRDSYQQPELVLQRVGIKNDSISADIGGGTGYFPIKIAKASPQGRVYSCDTTPQMVEHLKKRVAENNFANIIPVLAHADDPMIPEQVDFIFMVNTYHHIEDRVNYFKKLQSKLKPNGRIVNIDWKPGQLPMGPPESTKLSPDQVTEELKQAGFKLVDQPDLPTPYHYTVVYEVSN